MELRINEILKEKGMRMADLAKRIKIDQSNLSTSLKGNPKLSTLMDVASALGVEVRELFPETQPSFTAGTLQMGERHFVLVPVDAPQKPYVFYSERFLKEVKDFILRCLQDRKTISLCGLYKGVFPFGLIYDHESGRLFLSVCPDGDGGKTTVYHPQKPSPLKRLTTDEEDANRIAWNIMSDIEESL